MPSFLPRRAFLKQSVAAGVGLAALHELRAAERPVAASERVVLAVMGTNGRGRDLAAGFSARPDAAVAYICDVDERAAAKGVAATEGHSQSPPRVLADFRQALDDKAVDALVIAAPDHWHAPAAILACAAGKHVYVEKPASHNGAEGQLLVAASQKHRRVVQLGTQRRSSPSVIEAVGRVHAGELGKVLFARGWINSLRPTIGHGTKTAVPGWLKYDLWQGPAPAQPYRDNLVHYNWHWFWHWGTGELGNNGIHALDVCRWGLGVDYPERVVCGGGRFHFHDDQQTPDTQIATFHFGDRAINWEHRTWNKRGFEESDFGVAFYGEEGTLVLTSNQCRLIDKQGKQVSETALVHHDERHLANFLDAVRGTATANAEIEEGVKSTTLCHLGNIAYRTGRTVNFDAQTRRVVGDEEAAKLWSRDYQPGWEPRV
jgi:predicted dehydrogenase